MTADSEQHWNGVYASKGDLEVSWFEENPELSLSLIRGFGATKDAAIIDVGGGASRLVDALVASGQSNVAVLDLSVIALERARGRIPDADVDWIVADARTWKPRQQYDVWHDRGAFHFLVDPADQRSYVERLDQAVADGGTVIIGTFAPDGPEKCSGLPVVRHDSASLQNILGPNYPLIKQVVHDHRTPWGSIQHFQFSIFRRC